jgi:hypothetical protein
MDLQKFKPEKKEQQIAKHHNEFQEVTTENFQEQASTVLANANQGVQTKVVDGTGRVRAVIGLNGTRYLPNADPDPLDEILIEVISKEPK